MRLKILIISIVTGAILLVLGWWYIPEQTPSHKARKSLIDKNQSATHKDTIMPILWVDTESGPAYNLRKIIWKKKALKPFGIYIEADTIATIKFKHVDDTTWMYSIPSHIPLFHGPWFLDIDGSIERIDSVKLNISDVRVGQ